jgi:hypothetical protein
MGLDTTHNAWHGPYSSFNRFRRSLAEQIGIDLTEYYGYGDPDGKDLASIDHDIMPLLNHSDCDGRLTPKECRRIESGLNSILAAFKDTPADFDFKESVIQFRDGCKLAADKKEMLKFQ